MPFIYFSNKELFNSKSIIDNARKTIDEQRRIISTQMVHCRRLTIDNNNLRARIEELEAINEGLTRYHEEDQCIIAEYEAKMAEPQELIKQEIDISDSLASLARCKAKVKELHIENANKKFEIDLLTAKIQQLLEDGNDKKLEAFDDLCKEESSLLGFKLQTSTGTTPPKYIHKDPKLALAEADRLANVYKCDVTILEIVGKVKYTTIQVPVTETITQLEHNISDRLAQFTNSKDDLPF